MQHKNGNHKGGEPGAGGYSTLLKPYCLKCKIGISGAAETGHCAIDAPEKAEIMGQEIARAGLVLVTGATTGIPYWAAKGARNEGGLVIGFSPAASEEAHVKSYRLPTDYHDVMIYTGFDYNPKMLLTKLLALTEKTKETYLS